MVRKIRYLFALAKIRKQPFFDKHVAERFRIAKPPLRDGDKFAISGYRVDKDGRAITDCEPGTETIFTATGTGKMLRGEG